MTENDDIESWCTNCIGDTDHTFYSYYECDKCHTPSKAVNAVPAEELQDLVDEWEKTASTKAMHESRTFNAQCDVYQRCADELQERIDEYE